jgi:hypothetical protein
MKIKFPGQPDPDIFRDRKKYALWFAFFLAGACVSVGLAVFAVYFDTHHYKNLDNWAIGTLVGSSLGITWFGNRLQAYKKLYRPHREKLVELRSNHPEIEIYCAGVEAMGRELIKAEYEACIEFSEKHSTVPFT